MADTIKFTDEELGNINQLRQQIGQTFAQIGQLHLEKKRRIEEIDSQLLVSEGNYRQLVEQESQLFTQLNEKYGDGNFDPETGIFTPTPQEQVEEKVES